MLALVPRFTIFWFVFTMLNIGLPPSLNFFSEIVLISSIRSIRGYYLIVFGFSAFVTGCYNFYIYRAVCHGPRPNGVFIRSFFGSDRYLYSAYFSSVILLFGVVGFDFLSY